MSTLEDYEFLNLGVVEMFLKLSVDQRPGHFSGHVDAVDRGDMMLAVDVGALFQSLFERAL